MFSLSVIFSFRINELVFSTVVVIIFLYVLLASFLLLLAVIIFLYVLLASFLLLLSADICLHETMCLVISFVMFHGASHEHASVRFYYQLCYVTSVICHSNVQGHHQCGHLG